MSNVCVICQTDISDSNSSEAVVTLGCGHQFHTQCLLEWSQSNHASHGNCPSCRRPLVHTESVPIVAVETFPRNEWELCRTKASFRYALSKLRQNVRPSSLHYESFKRMERSLTGKDQALSEAKLKLRHIKKKYKKILKTVKSAETQVSTLEGKVRSQRRLILALHPIETILRVVQQNINE